MGPDVAPSSEAPPVEKSIQFSFVEAFAGATAGFAEHFVMFPFDTLKTRMQSGVSGNLLDVVRQLWRTERLTNFYRGCAPVLVAAIPSHAAYFGVYEAVKRVLGGDHSNICIAASACCATVAHDVVSNPFDVVKQRMQMDQKRTFRSSLACGRQILRREGVPAFFVSLPTTIVMNIPHFSTYWLVYEGVMSHQTSGGSARDYENEMAADYLAAGFIAGGAASVVSFPFDTVKTQLQLGRATSFSKAFKNVFAQRGLKGLFNGVLPRVIYTAPSGAIMMVTYETTRSALSFEEGLN